MVKQVRPSDTKEGRMFKAIVNKNLALATELAAEGRLNTQFDMPKRPRRKHGWRYIPEYNYSTMTAEAIYSNNPSFVKLLMDQRRFNPNEELSWGYRVFHVACSRGNLEIVKAFLDYPGTDVAHHMNFDRRTPLYNAVASGRKEVVRMLIESGKKLHPTKNGFFAGNFRSIFVVADGDQEMVDLLKKWKAEKPKDWECYCGCRKDPPNPINFG